ncbi:uncharacterized protein LOC116120755 [Pistacia vera]|uniref:uncharacterized protein LOC116120755 n=1 Tax=Pistacia vera TaxID=55513 RepID=UPI001263A662|nr:uncharacterized protein LOC116120755 [Pistacia vera]
MVNSSSEMAMNPTDSNSQLYIHSSDTPGSVLVTEQLTGTDNYGIMSRDLQEQYHKISGTRIYGIQREIVNLTQGTMSVAIYYNKLKFLWDELSSLISLPQLDSVAAKAYLNHLNQQKLLQFLMGLNDTYSMVRSQILLMSPLPSVKQAYSVVKQDESQRISIGANVGSDVTTALYA